MSAIHVTPMTPAHQHIVTTAVLRLRAVEIVLAAGILFWLGWHAAATF